MPGGVGSLAWMMKSSRVMAGGDDCEGVTCVSVNDKKNMIATVADGPLRGQPYAYGPDGNSQGTDHSFSLM